MAEDPAHTDPVHVLPGGQDDCGQLGPVAPLGQGRHGEALDEDLAHQGHGGHFTSVVPALQISSTLFLLPLPQLLVDLLKLLLALVL